MKKTIALIITLVITLSAALTGCGYTYKELNLRAKFDQSLKGTTLTVYNWGEYISDGSEGSYNVNEEFTKLTGIRVNYETFDSNESTPAAYLLLHAVGKIESESVSYISFPLSPRESLVISSSASAISV